MVNRLPQDTVIAARLIVRAMLEILTSCSSSNSLYLPSAELEQQPLKQPSLTVSVVPFRKTNTRPGT